MNFHSNTFVITANDEDMKKVLTRIAQNLLANEQPMSFSESDILAAWDVEALFGEIRSDLSEYYNFAFSGAEVSPELLKSGNVGWKSRTGQEDYLNNISDAFNAVVGGTFGDVTISAVQLNRPGCYASDSASIAFEQCGSNWALTMNYDTGWAPNDEETDLFFLGLPKGTYGIAFFDADEYDGYETVNVFSGLHAGQAVMHDVVATFEDMAADADELKGMRSDYEGLILSAIDDLSELAHIVATRNWKGFEFTDDEYDYDYEDDPEGALWDVDWKRPNRENRERIGRALITNVCKLPWTAPITGSAYEGREANVEKLVAGDYVVLESNWQSQYFEPVGILVKTTDGKELGNLDNDFYVGLGVDSFERALLACMLPYVTAWAERVEPLSTRSGYAKHSSVLIHIELADKGLSDLMEDAQELLKQPLAERTRTSVVEEVQ